MAVSIRPFGELFLEPTRNGLTRPQSVRGSGVKMVNMGELFAYPRIQDISMDRVQLSTSEAERFLLVAGDLLFARQSLVLEGAGKCSIFLGDDEPVTFESHVTRVRLDPQEADPLYYFYYLESHHGRSAIRSIVEQGAGASGIRGSDLSNLPVQWRPIDEQKAVSGILGILDDKIELNKKMNETLSTFAKALFQSWFVDFVPARTKGDGLNTKLPKSVADMFPDSMEVSTLGEIPKGWQVGKFGDVSTNPRRGIAPDQIPDGTPYIALDQMPRRSISLAEWKESRGLESGKFEFKMGEILFGKLRPYFHKVGVAPIDGVCSTDILVITPVTTDWFGFALGHASSDAFVESANLSSTGTKMPRTNWHDMASFPVVLPPPELAKVYNDLVSPIVERIIVSIHKSRTLAAIRNVLLQSLMSGQGTVEDAQRIVGGLD